MQRNARSVRCRIFAADVAWLCLALLCAYGIRHGFRDIWRITQQDGQYLPVLGISVAAWACIYSPMRLDGFQRGWNWSKVSAEAVVGVAILAGSMATYAYATQDYVPRTVLLYYSALLVPGFLGIRAFQHTRLTAGPMARRRRVVIIGNGSVARELSQKLQRHPEMMCDVVGFLYPSSLESARALGEPALEGFSVQSLGALDLLKQQDVTDAILVLSGQRTPSCTMDLVTRCREAGISVSVVPLSYELYLSKPTLIDLDGLPIISLGQAEPGRVWTKAKRVFDIAFGLALTIVTAPLVALLALQLKFSKGSAFHNETRCGENGLPFTMFRLNVERNGPYCSRFERILDDLSLSELPQVWNVLRGEMSVVGPRPENPERVKHYSAWQRQRLAVKPGITGLAQVHGLRDQHSSEDKARFDLQYIVSSNPVSDLVLVLQTIWTLAVRLYSYSSCRRLGKGGSETYRFISPPEVANADRAHSGSN